MSRPETSVFLRPLGRSFMSPLPTVSFLLLFARFDQVFRIPTKWRSRHPSHQVQQLKMCWKNISSRAVSTRCYPSPINTLQLPPLCTSHSPSHHLNHQTPEKPTAPNAAVAVVGCVSISPWAAHYSPIHSQTKPYMAFASLYGS